MLHREVPCSFSVVGNLCSSTLFFDMSFIHPFANTRDQGACVMQENGDKQCVSESCTTMAPSTTQYFSSSMARE